MLKKLKNKILKKVTDKWVIPWIASEYSNNEVIGHWLHEMNCKLKGNAILTSNKDVEDVKLLLSLMFYRDMHTANAKRELANAFDFEVLSPLAFTADEWNEVSEGIYQNIRCASVFMNNGKIVYNDALPLRIDAIYNTIDDKTETGIISRGVKVRANSIAFVFDDSIMEGDNTREYIKKHVKVIDTVQEINTSNEDFMCQKHELRVAELIIQLAGGQKECIYVTFKKELDNVGKDFTRLYNVKDIRETGISEEYKKEIDDTIDYLVENRFDGKIFNIFYEPDFIESETEKEKA